METKTHNKAHCLVVPYPVVGHINPMLQFSKRLQHKGVHVTLVLTRTVFKTMHEVCGSVAIETISDGEQDWRPEPGSLEAYLARFQQFGSQTLADLIIKNQSKVDCIVYDAFLPWVLDVAKSNGIHGAVFFTQSCAVDNIYYHVQKGLLKLPLQGPEVTLPGIPPLHPSDMPSFIYDFGSYPEIFRLLLSQNSNVDEADLVLCNTFDKLEEEVINWMAKILPVRTIGPAIPSWYLDKKIQDDKEYGFNMYKPQTDACIEWLNKKPDASVAYVSFGSVAELPGNQIQELIGGLKGCKKSFLWVVRASEQAKLPRNFLDDDGKEEEEEDYESSSDRGLVVSWCPQLEVLAHRAVGCFVTHCGWNSTLEALSLGVPMVAMPRWTDQNTNAKYVADVWKTGVKARPDEEGVVRKQEIELCIMEVMEGEKSKEIRANAKKWRDLAREAVDEGGSSDKNIDDFVSTLVRLSGEAPPPPPAADLGTIVP